MVIAKENTAWLTRYYLGNYETDESEKGKNYLLDLKEHASILTSMENTGIIYKGVSIKMEVYYQNKLF